MGGTQTSHPTPSQIFCLEYLNLVVRVKVDHILIKGCLIGLKKVPRQRQELDENRQSWWSQSKISFPHRRNQEKFFNGKSLTFFGKNGEFWFSISVWQVLECLLGIWSTRWHFTERYCFLTNGANCNPGANIYWKTLAQIACLCTLTTQLLLNKV